jgi:hypothetical protein
MFKLSTLLAQLLAQLLEELGGVRALLHREQVLLIPAYGISV